MAILSDVERQAVWSDVMREVSRIREEVTINNSDLRAAINAVDAWVDGNASSFNAAIPQPARSQLTSRQKAMLFTYVVFRRFINS